MAETVPIPDLILYILAISAAGIVAYLSFANILKIINPLWNLEISISSADLILNIVLLFGLMAIIGAIIAILTVILIYVIRIVGFDDERLIKLFAVVISEAIVIVGGLLFLIFNS
ncbi:MAG: hypothetical protein ACFFC7_23795 [Candidatus Hermodarchaeota archaeon]